MAEFVEVMKQMDRMCDSYGGWCCGCGLRWENNGTDLHCLDYVDQHTEEAEKIIMTWAAAHPEPKYPSWAEAWKQLFPSSYFVTKCVEKEVCPCPHYFIPAEPDKKRCQKSCSECKRDPIPADIAEKLGIKPLEVVE